MKKLNKKTLLILLAIISAQVLSGCSNESVSTPKIEQENSVIVVETPANTTAEILRPDLTTATEPIPETEAPHTIDEKEYPKDEYFYENLGDGENSEIIPIKYSDAKSTNDNVYTYDVAYINDMTPKSTYPSGNSIENPELFNEALNDYSDEIKKENEILSSSEYIKLSVGDVYGKNNMKVTGVEKKVKKVVDEDSFFGKTESTTISYEGTAKMKGYVTDDGREVFFAPYTEDAKGVLPILNFGSNSLSIYEGGKIGVGDVTGLCYYLGKSGTYDTSKWGSSKFIEAEVTITNPTYINVWDTSDVKEMCYLVEKSDIKLIKAIEKKGE